jgi:cell division protein FtsB
MRNTFSFKKNKDARENKVRDKIINLFLLIVVVLFIISLIQTSVKIRRMNDEVKSRENQLARLKKEEGELKEKYEEITSSEYMEKQLRNNLNLAKDNEIILVLPDDEILKKLVPPDVQEEGYDMRPNWKKWLDVFGIQL